MILKLKQFRVILRNLFIFLFVFMTLIYVIIKFFGPKKSIDFVPRYLHKYLHPMCIGNCAVPNLEDLLDKVESENQRREVRNWAQFGPVLPETLYIVVQVHTDLEQLQYLIISLAQVQHIDRTLVIFSHSFYDEKMNYVIQLIDFCMVLQIYYPFSVQLYPNFFPGLDPDDCTNLSRAKCNFCVERDGRYTEKKHQWWWTATFVFDRLAWSKEHTAMVIFMEGDSYVLPDLLHMFKFCKGTLSYISDADVLSFGRSLANGLDYDKLTVDTWRPPYDKGLAFNITTWRKIFQLRTHFCEYNDTSWSYSLMRLFEHFPRGRAVMVACMAPRVLSTGVFHNESRAMEDISYLIHTQPLFPEAVQTVVLFGQNGKVLRHPKAPKKGNGGWGDNRDYLLCFDPLAVTATEDSTTTT